jgi:hypothetical protein
MPLKRWLNSCVLYYSNTPTPTPFVPFAAFLGDKFAMMWFRQCGIVIDIIALNFFSTLTRLPPQTVYWPFVTNNSAWGIVMESSLQIDLTHKADGQLTTAWQISNGWNYLVLASVT